MRVKGRNGPMGRAWSNSICHAVTAATGTDAASLWESLLGLRAIIFAEAAAYTFDMTAAVTPPVDSFLRNAEHRELFLSGLRLAAGEVT